MIPTDQEARAHVAHRRKGLFVAGRRKGQTVQLRVACAWCGTEIRAGEEPTTHGICRTCNRELLGPTTPTGA